MSRLTRFFVAPVALACLIGSAMAQTPLRTGIDPNFPPHAFPKLSGGYQGFNVELGEEIARRLGRPLEIEGAQYSALIPALNAGKFDFLMAPTTVSAERAKTVLLTEGYMNNDFTIVVKKSRNDLNTLEDFRGKTLAVNKGSGPEEWARAHQEQYGYEIAVYGTNADAVQAVISGRADGNLAGLTPSAWAVKSNGSIKTTAVIETGSVWSIPFRLDDKAGRDQVSMVLKCMKKDGSLAALYTKWFGAEPLPNSATVVSPPGHGVEGLNGYDATPVELNCN
ncbi:polar amino acid ABC transporter substrate-binding protein [Lampropedia cohaerens]|uniref:Polar amino acid ABC transporter substrate-binding protein n=1 Tax=Lampropedia cohaerens TaxID=1610491 RepID=A0A0U1Q210_9BURK|nr:transporter substrate-binding domain-containing protein [Lampropedia cohaerens]KKW68793.1 polar amino acid ABC transporter substrate-binding protein [Lampropedia cohaerens]